MLGPFLGKAWGFESLRFEWRKLYWVVTMIKIWMSSDQFPWSYWAKGLFKKYAQGCTKCTAFSQSLGCQEERACVVTKVTAATCSLCKKVHSFFTLLDNCVCDVGNKETRPWRDVMRLRSKITCTVSFDVPSIVNIKGAIIFYEEGRGKSFAVLCDFSQSKQRAWRQQAKLHLRH